VVSLKISIKDKASLINAVKRLGGEWVESATTYTWWGRHMRDYPLPVALSEKDLGICHHKISFPNCCYEVGIIEVDRLPADHPARNVTDANGVRVYADGSFVPIFDFIDSSLKQIMGGPQAHKFVQAYKAAQTINAIRRQHRGAKITEKVDQKTGKIQIEATLTR
jgi:hypothetical protein